MNSNTGSQLQPGFRIGQYVIEERIGEGGMGSVYRAVDTHLERHVAIKVISQSFVNNKEILERFKLEGKTLARLSHPNIISVYNFGNIENIYFIVMELVNGVTFTQYLNKQKHGLKELMFIFKQLLLGVRAAHQNQIIHRDLKRDNILVLPDLSVKILDFGIAKVFDNSADNLTRTGQVLGTVRYVAPEVILGAEPSFQSDVYSLGVIFYEAITKEAPFTGKNDLETLEKVKTERIEFNPRMQSLLPQALQSLVLQMCEKSPRHRFRDIDEVLEHFTRIAIDQRHEKVRMTADVEVSGATTCEPMQPEAPIQNVPPGAVDINRMTAEDITGAEELELDSSGAIEPAAGQVNSGNTMTGQNSVLSSNKTLLRAEQIKANTHEVPQQVGGSLDKTVIGRSQAAQTKRNYQLNQKKQAHIRSELRSGERVARAKRTGTVLLATVLLGLSGLWFTDHVGFQWLADIFNPQEIEHSPLPPTTATAYKTKPPQRNIAEANLAAPVVSDPAAKVKKMPFLPDLVQGTTFEYQHKLFDKNGKVFLSQRRKFEVMNTQPEAVVWRLLGSGSQVASRNPFLGTLNIRDTYIGDGRPDDYEGPKLEFMDLKVGNRMVLNRTDRAISGVDQYECEAKSRQSITVSAGKFDTIKVECATNGGTRSRKETFYYAPAIKHWVLRDTAVSDGKNASTSRMELVRFQVPNK